MTRLLQRQDQRLGVAQKPPALRRQAGAGAVTHEQACTEKILQALDARADGGLGDVQARSGLDKASAGRDRQKCSDLFGIHSD